MKIIFLTLFIAAMVHSACRVQTCTTDDSSLREFNRHLNLIKDVQEKKLGVYVGEYLESVFFLGQVTGIHSKYPPGHAVGYKVQEDYLADKMAWETWLKNNVCKLSKRYIDSSINAGKFK